MAIILKEFPCPFCKARSFTLNAFINDEYEPSFDPDDATRRSLSVSCVDCGQVVLHVDQAVDGSTQVHGVSRIFGW